MNPREKMAAEIQEEIAWRERKLHALNLVPGQDVYDEGTMLRVRVQSPSDPKNVLTYLLLKVGGHIGGDSRDGLWYHTGKIYRRNTGWSQEAFRGWEQLMWWALQQTIVSWEELVVKPESTGGDA